MHKDADMPPELIQWLPRSIVYSVLLIVAAAFVLSRLAEAFEVAANMMGPPGRWIRRRYQKRAAQRQEELQHTIREAVKEAADYKVLQRRIETLDRLVKKLEAEITKLELVEATSAARQDMTAEYLREDAQWHIDAGVLAAERKIKLPPHRSYTRFCREYREKHGMQYGRRWNDPDPGAAAEDRPF